MSKPRCPRWSLAARLLAGCWLACVGAASVAQPTATPGARPAPHPNVPQMLLAGVLINGQDSGASVNLLPTDDGSYRVDLDQFAAALKSRVRDLNGQLQIPTPLGPANLPAASVTPHDRARFVPLAGLARALAAEIRFDPAEFALRVKLAWTPGVDHVAAAAGASSDSGETPDIRAPAASLSAIHSEAYFSHQSSGNSLATLTDLQGALGPGSWRTRILTTSPGGRQSMQNYGWTLDEGKNRFYLGHTQLALDPLLPYADLTGAQYAWSSRPDISYGDDVSNNELVATQSLGGQSLSGTDGPPGGIAELRIDGRVVARTPIRLDGSWAFRDIALRGTEFAQVALYERFGDGTPIRVEPVSAATSPRSLPAGMLVSYAGLGVNGNPLDAAVPTGGMGGFYQLRWGVNDHLTVDAATQRAAGRDYAVSNAIVGLGALGTWGFGVGSGGSASSWSVQGGGLHGMWFWNAYARHYGGGYFPGQALAQSDRYGEFGAHLTHHFDLSLIGRDATDPTSGTHYRFLKPAINWVVNDQLNVNARPDYNGSYAYTAQWNARTDTQITLSRYVSISQLELRQALSHDMQVDVAITRDPQLGTRYSQTLSGLWASRRPLSWSAGLLEGGGRIGYLLDAALEAVPGLSAHVQLYNDPINRGVSGGTTLQLSLVADFAVTSSGLARGDYSARAARRGSISGRVTGELPTDVKWSDLAGIQVLVDGQPRGALDSDGRYFVGNLPPGVYRLQMDSDKLPIDLMPPASAPLVQVRVGDTTRADFAMQLRLGFAGRLIDPSGQPDAGGWVEVLDATNQVVAHTRSNALGYYRIDQLAPGVYTLRAAGVKRSVTLDRAFVYGQDLVAPAGALIHRRR